MSENEAAAVQEAEGQAEFEYPVTIEEAGPATKKVRIEVPADRIAAKLEESFKELRREAAIPGFRPGHAPRKLIEKRFSQDVRDQVRRSLISESYQQAVEKHSLQVIGEPDFENPEAIKLPEEGAMSYSFQVEVQPEINLPDFAGIKVRRPKIAIKDENVDQAMQNLREQQGALTPVEDRGVQSKDFLTADVKLSVDGNEIAQQSDAQLVARAGRVAGLQIDDFDKQLEGLKPGESRTVKTTVPGTYPNESLRGKEAVLEVQLKDIKQLVLADVNEEFLEDLGFTNEQELRDALREQMEEKIGDDVQQAMRDQVSKFLADNVQIELPAKMSDRQADRVVNRRAVELLMRGVPRDQIEANVERLRHGARDEAARELKLFFILQKVANDLNVDVSEAELNGRIALIAAQRNLRPERLKQDMSKDGSLASMYIQMREQKALDQILEKAQIEEYEPTPGETQAAGEAPAAQAGESQPQG